MNIGWPQGIFIGMLIVELLIYAILLDGRPKVGTYSLAIKMLGVALIVALLFWGGFFHV